MFATILIKDGNLTNLSLETSIKLANKNLRNYFSDSSSKDSKELPELVSVDMSSELDKLENGQEFMVKTTTFVDSSIVEVNTEGKTEEKDEEKREQLESWKKYKKTIVTITTQVPSTSWLSIFGNGTALQGQESRAELVCEYKIVEMDMKKVSEFVQNHREQEQEKMIVHRSSEVLAYMCAEYEVDKSDPCIPFKKACQIGDSITQSLRNEDREKLISWCLKKLQDTKPRADVYNLIGLTYRIMKKESEAVKYFKLSAELDYPLAMNNLLESTELHPLEFGKWRIRLSSSRYPCY
jgi:hypothetical protein